MTYVYYDSADIVVSLITIKSPIASASGEIDAPLLQPGDNMPEGCRCLVLDDNITCDLSKRIYKVAGDRVVPYKLKPKVIDAPPTNDRLTKMEEALVSLMF